MMVSVTLVSSSAGKVGAAQAGGEASHLQAGPPNKRDSAAATTGRPSAIGRPPHLRHRLAVRTHAGADQRRREGHALEIQAGESSVGIHVDHQVDAA